MISNKTPMKRGKLPSKSAKKGMMGGYRANVRNRLHGGSGKLRKVSQNLKKYNQGFSSRISKNPK